MTDVIIDARDRFAKPSSRSERSTSDEVASTSGGRRLFAAIAAPVAFGLFAIGMAKLEKKRERF